MVSRLKADNYLYVSSGCQEGRYMSSSLQQMICCTSNSNRQISEGDGYARPGTRVWVYHFPDCPAGRDQYRSSVFYNSDYHDSGIMEAVCY